MPKHLILVAGNIGSGKTSLTERIGQRLGCGGHLSALRRTRSGKFTLDRAVSVADLKTAPREDLLKAMVTLAEISLMRGA